MPDKQLSTDMQDFLIKAGIILLICLSTAAIIAFGIYSGAYARADKHPNYPDKRELDRREYEDDAATSMKSKTRETTQHLAQAVGVH